MMGDMECYDAIRGTRKDFVTVIQRLRGCVMRETTLKSTYIKVVSRFSKSFISILYC